MPLRQVHHIVPVTEGAGAMRHKGHVSPYALWLAHFSIVSRNRRNATTGQQVNAPFLLFTFSLLSKIVIIVDKILETFGGKRISEV